MLKSPLPHPRSIPSVWQPSIWQTTIRALFKPIDIAALVYFRIAFGLIMLWEVWRYLSKGWIDRYWIAPDLHFTYYGFGWVHPWPGYGMYLHFLWLGILAIGIAIGCWYRICTILFFLGFTYVFLLEQAHYLNHFYLICLISFLLIFLPAHRACSWDVQRHPGLLRSTAPAWTLWLLRIQIGIPYLYGGFAKLNGDWLQGQPMGMWLSESTDFPLVGSVFTEPWMAYLLSYSGLFLDLLVVPGLLWRRTRWIAFGFAVAFHLTNARLFSIGIFPWFMIAATAMFFAPSWPRRFGLLRHQAVEDPVIPPRRRQRQALVLSFLGLYLGLQLLVPFRHHLYPGNVNWTEEGHRFAWHMKLRDKEAIALFHLSNPQTGLETLIDPEDYLSPLQVRKMGGRPDMILQFAHYLAETKPQVGDGPVEVRAQTVVSLNGRPGEWLIDPDVDLAKQPRNLWPADWILPLESSVPRP